MVVANDPAAFAARKVPTYFEYWFVYVALFATAVFPILSKYQSADQPSANSPIAQVVWTTLYLVAAYRIYVMRERARPLLGRSRILAAFVLLMLASFVWSVEPSTTLLNSIELIGTTVIGYYIVARFTLAEFLEIAALTFGTVAVFSYALIFGAPGHGRMDWGTGAWSGIYQDKNNLGAAMSLAVISLVALLLRREQRLRPVIFGVLVACVVLLIGSNSATAFADCVVAGALSLAALLCRSPRFGMLARVATVLVVVFGVLAVFVFGFTPDAMFSALGRSSTLTGRTDFWPYLQQAIGDRPLLGYGYNAFFRSFVGANYLSYYVVEAGGWTPYHAHNSFFQICLDAGYVGLAFLLYLIASGLWRSVAYVFREPARVAAWPVGIVLYLLLGSFTETYLGNYNTFEWIFFVAALLYPFRDRALAIATRRSGDEG